MRRTALALSLLAAPTLAQDFVVVGQPDPMLGASTLTLRPSEQPEAVAEVEFYNADMNLYRDEMAYPMSLDGLEIEVDFEVNVDPLGSDRIRVRVPPGYYADPDTLDVMEGQTGVVLIFQHAMM